MDARCLAPVTLNMCSVMPATLSGSWSGILDKALKDSTTALCSMMLPRTSENRGRSRERDDHRRSVHRGQISKGTRGELLQRDMGKHIHRSVGHRHNVRCKRLAKFLQQTGKPSIYSPVEHI
eukprot:3083038-Amphidinium_carterae.2